MKRESKLLNELNFAATQVQAFSCGEGMGTMPGRKYHKDTGFAADPTGDEFIEARARSGMAMDHTRLATNSFGRAGKDAHEWASKAHASAADSYRKLGYLHKARAHEAFAKAHYHMSLHHTPKNEIKKRK